MMRIMCIAGLVFSLAACGSGVNPDTESQHQETPVAVNIQQLLEMAPESIGSEVWVSGVVTHVCRHSGRRCFISDGENSIRIEATGNIYGFNNELQGTGIYVKGVVRERRLEAEFIEGLEIKALADMVDDDHNHDDGEHCSAELDNIREMKAWMQANNKNYFSVYFLDGTEYQVAD